MRNAHHILVVFWCTKTGVELAVQKNKPVMFFPQKAEATDNPAAKIEIHWMIINSVACMQSLREKKSKRHYCKASFACLIRYPVGSIQEKNA